MEEEQEAEVGMAVFEAYYTEIAAAARPAAANMVEEAEVVMDMAAAVAIMEVVDFLFFEPSVRLARSSFGHSHLHYLLIKLHIFSPEVFCLFSFGFCLLSFFKLRRPS